jgi:signal transduction histidine kinase
MEAEVERAAEEIKRLKACINNLISVQALPAIWSGGQPSQILSALLDVLLEMLSLDFAYARLMDSTNGTPVEMVRFAQDRNLTAQPQIIGRALNSWLEDFADTSPLLVRNPLGDGEVSVLLLRLGQQAEIGVFVAGSKRPDFPTQTERLLLNVAMNGATIGLQEARFLGEQKRVAEELDERVARRTSQLRAANEELEREIAARKQAEALLAGEKRLLEMVARGDSLTLILDALCRLVEELASGSLSSILLLEPNGNRLRHGAARSLPKAYIDAIDGSVIDASAGSCGTAAYRAKSVIVSDIANDPLWTNYRDVAMSHGLRACWSTPILSSEGKVLGTFAIYYREPRTPTPQELEIIERTTHLASIALERKRAENALRASEQVARGQAEALAQSLDILATAPDPEKLIGQMLSTIRGLLNAQNASLWLFDESSDSLVLRLQTNGAKRATADARGASMKDPLFLKQNPIVQELLLMAGPVICADVESDPRISENWRDDLQQNGTKRFLVVPILVGGQVRGLIGVQHADRATYEPEEIELTQALAHQVMLAIQLNQSAEQSQQAAVLEERNRMARDIHDTLAQGLTGVIVQLQAAEDATSKGYKKDARNHLQNARELARHGLSEARRSVRALRPQVLEDATFWEALQTLIKSATVGTELHAEFQLRGKVRDLPEKAQENFLHIGQEALTNTLKYAHATRFETRLRFNSREVRLEFQDDGNGFKVNGRHGGFGLTGMRERIDQLGGSLAIVSARGKGTKIVVAFPDK